MSRIAGLTNLRINRREIIKKIPLLLVLAAITVSFFHVWYSDPSKPVAGRTWADQNLYSLTSDRLVHGMLPTAEQLHFQIGYPLLGAAGHLFSQADPFVAVSLLLMLGSVAFCYLAAERLFGPVWAVLFSALLFYRDGHARIFRFASDLFAVPWNNQVLFFTMAFYLWLLVTQLDKKPSYKMVTLTGLISGLCFLTRQETILFILPVLAFFWWATRPEPKKTALLFGITLVCYLPQIIVQKVVVGKAVTSGRTEGYGSLLDLYFRPHFLNRNLWETVADSKHFSYITGLHPKRPALLQAQPWLWAAPAGIALVLFLRKFPKGLKAFMVISVLLMLFYLSGYNMSAQKLQFNCLRYITPGFIALNLAVIILAREILLGGKTLLFAAARKGRPGKK